MVMADESNSEPFYTSAAHDTNDLEQTLNAFETTMKVYIKSKKWRPEFLRFIIEIMVNEMRNNPRFSEQIKYSSD